MKLLLALLLMIVPMFASAAPMSEAQKIDALIQAVERQPGAVFIRNGDEHSASEAAAHLRMKYKRAGKRVKTADDFIRYLATSSMMSGKKYRIRFKDGQSIDSADFFRAELRKLEAPGSATSQSALKTPGRLQH